MYRLREEYIDEFKELRTITYANILGCDAAFISTVLNGNKWCSEIVAKALISVKENGTLKEICTNEYLEKYFVKEK